MPAPFVDPTHPIYNRPMPRRWVAGKEKLASSTAFIDLRDAHIAEYDATVADVDLLGRQMVSHPAGRAKPYASP